MAETSADLTIRLILHPERAARLQEFHSRDTSLPGFEYVMDRLLEDTWLTVYEDSYLQEIQRIVNHIVLYYAIELINNKEVPQVVRSLAHLKLIQLNNNVLEIETDDKAQLAQYLQLDLVLKLLESNPGAIKLTPPSEPPMGAPI
jgi:hypothetical protein